MIIPVTFGSTMEEFRLLAEANGAHTRMRRPTDAGESLDTFRAAMLDAFAQLPGAAFVRAQNSSATWLEARAAALGARASCDA
ncbi:hypothetical protein MK139_07130, partial [bacterium]|nr:hypothetical protein [bacterium]